MSQTIERARKFCDRFGLQAPILLARMAGASSPSLSIAVANAGGLGSCGVLLMQPDEIRSWSQEVRSNSNGTFQLNIWIPDAAPMRDPAHEAALREFLESWSPAVPAEAGDAVLPVFTDQCEAMLEVAPPILSSVMGLYPANFVKRMKERGITWFANISTVAEAKAAEAAGADVIVAQGAEAGGHRGCFEAGAAEAEQVGLLTGFLRCPESKIHPAWSDALTRTAPEDTIVSRVFSGRADRSIATNYVLAALDRAAPRPAPYPVQRGLTAPIRTGGTKEGDIHRMQAWAGQSADLAQIGPAAVVFQNA